MSVSQSPPQPSDKKIITTTTTTNMLPISEIFTSYELPINAFGLFMLNLSDILLPSVEHPTSLSLFVLSLSDIL